MKARESGMPAENLWDQFYDADKILNELEVTGETEKLVDLGFGYGTFTIPAARRIRGRVYAFDIEEPLAGELERKLSENNISNVVVINKDFIDAGTGLPDEEADYVMLFNILHAERSEEIVKESFRILRKNGKAGVIHWRYDPATPRGPSMEIRPKPEDLKNLLIKEGFTIIKYNIDLPPYHYGILAKK